jgi:hypothetical protein
VGTDRGEQRHVVPGRVVFYCENRATGWYAVRNDIPAVEAALQLCEASRHSVAEAKIAIAEIHRTIERVHETRRRTAEILASSRAR